jgi:hypothetical protein
MDFDEEAVCSFQTAGGGGGVEEILCLHAVQLLITERSQPYIMASGSKFREVIGNSFIFISPEFVRVNQAISRWGGTKGSGLDRSCSGGNNWRAVVNIVVNLGVPHSVGNFLSGCGMHINP